MTFIQLSVGLLCLIFFKPHVSSSFYAQIPIPYLYVFANVSNVISINLRKIHALRLHLSAFSTNFSAQMGAAADLDK